MSTTKSHQVLTSRIAAGGFDLHSRDLHVGCYLAVRLVVAHGSLVLHAALPPDASWGLRDAGGISVGCKPQSARTLEPHLVHGVVERCAQRNHGSAVSGEP